MVDKSHLIFCIFQAGFVPVPGPSVRQCGGSGGHLQDPVWPPQELAGVSLLHHGQVSDLTGQTSPTSGQCQHLSPRQLRTRFIFCAFSQSLVIINFKYNLNYHLLKENFLVATKRMMCSACSSDQPRKSPTKPPVSAT